MDQQEAIRALYLEGKTIRDRNQGGRTYRFDPSSGNVVNQVGETELVCFSPDVEWTAVDTTPLKVGDVVKDDEGVRAEVVYVDDEVSMIREEVSRKRRFIFHEHWQVEETRWTNLGESKLNQGEEKETEGSPLAKAEQRPTSTKAENTWLKVGDELTNVLTGERGEVSCVGSQVAWVRVPGKCDKLIRRDNWDGAQSYSGWRRSATKEEQKGPHSPRREDEEAEAW